MKKIILFIIIFSIITGGVVFAEAVIIENYDGSEEAIESVLQILKSGSHPYNLYDSNYNLLTGVVFLRKIS